MNLLLQYPLATEKAITILLQRPLAVIQIIENKIFLKETFFYARSGGQPGDQGTITIENKKLNVIDTVKEEGLFAHIVDQEVNISEGTLISAKILWEKRHRHMRMHTTMHLLCSVLPFYVIIRYQLYRQFQK